MPKIKITEITLYWDDYDYEPVQGFCEVDGEKMVFEEIRGHGGRYQTFRLTDEEWEVVNRQPRDAAGFKDLEAIHITMLGRGHVHELTFEEAEWPKECS